MTVSQQISPSSVRNYKISKYPSDKTKRLLREARKAKQATSRFMAKKNAKEAAKRMKDVKKITNALKKGNLKEVNSKWGTALTLFVDAVQVGFTTFMVFKNAEIQAYNIKTQEAQEAGIQNAFTRSINNSIQIKTLQKTTQELKQSDQKTRDRIYGIEKQQVTIREKANDALYEVRKGREILEGKISDARKLGNDALAEARQARVKIEAKISEVQRFAESVSNNFKARIENIYQSANNALKEAQAASTSVNKLNSEVSSVNSKVIKIGSDISTISTNLTTKISSVENVAKQALDVAKTIPKIINQNFNQQQPTLTKIVGGIVADVKLELARSSDEKLNKELAKYTKQFNDNYRQSQGDSKLQQQRFEQTVRDFEEAWNRQRTQVGKTFSDALKDIEAEREKLAEQVKQTKPTTIPLPLPELDRIQKDNNQIKKDLDKLNTRLKEQEKVNESALPKLDSILNLIPLIPARAAGLITPTIPTPNDIEKATGTAVCRSLNGGCAGRALNDAVSNVNKNANQNKSDLLDKINTGANAAELALLKTIDKKLGDQLPGGIGKVVSKITRNQAINQIANLVTMAAAIHNTIQLSDNVAVTFFGILDNIFAIPTLIINPEGSTIDTREVFSGAIENVMKSVFGVEEWAEIKAKWQTFNRIYQAGANSINEIRSVGASLNDAISTTATLTGRGFNALQNDGVLSEYNWEPTPENLRLKGGIYGKLGKLADGISVVGETLEAIESVTSEIRSAVESANQIKSNTTEMEAEINKLLGDETKKRDEAIAALQAPTFNYEDLL